MHGYFSGSLQGVPMKLFWFMTNPDGDVWSVIAAFEEETAWRLLAEKSYSNKEGQSGKGISSEEMREQYSLAAVTELDGKKEGEVASIFPHEVNFYIKTAPGSDTPSMITNH